LQLDAETPGRLIFLEQSEAESMIDNDAVFDEDHYGQRPSGATYSPRGAAADDDARHSDNEATREDGHDAHRAMRSAASQESIQALEALPVKVSFDLGSVTVALSALRRWQPGEAIELTAPVSERQVVNIRANGMLIGQGELVDIDGHLGVIVSTLSEACEAADHE
jgi:flagellar motor switch/type III secretory pathway protein FliN